jgi:hypothetical protein
MALAGSLKDLHLDELLQLLAGKEGALEIWNVKGVPATTLYLKPGRIRSVDQKGKPLPPLAPKAVLITLLQAREGAFEFIPGARPAHAHRLNWPIERALLSLVTLTDEMARQDLPPPEARFRLVKATGSLPCQDLLGQAGELLARGASVEEIARELGLPWTYVAFCLRRLQAAGAVRPTLTMGR